MILSSNKWHRPSYFLSIFNHLSNPWIYKTIADYKNYGYCFRGAVNLIIIIHHQKGNIKKKTLLYLKKNSFVFRICFEKFTKTNSVSLIIRCCYLFCKFIITTRFVIGLDEESTSTIQYTLGLYTLLKL